MRFQPQTMAPGITLRRMPRIDLISTEPHMPHVLMEKGDMTLGEFDQHLKRRTDFIKGMKKDSSAERKVRGTEAESQGWQNQGGIGNLVFTRPVKRQGLSGGVTYSRSHSKLVAAPCQSFPQWARGTAGQREMDFQMQQSPWAVLLPPSRSPYPNATKVPTPGKNSRLMEKTTSVCSRQLHPQGAPGNLQPGALPAASLFLSLCFPTC